MNFDDLTRGYFGSADVDDLPVEVIAAAVERMQVDLGLEKDPARRFALWSFLFMLDAAPALDVVFKEPADRDAARDFMNLVDTPEYL